MSTTPVTPVTGVNPQKAAENAITDADNHTPPSPVTNDPPTPTTDPTDGDDKKGDREKTVTELATNLTALTETVAGLASKLISADDSPTARVPWTHRGGKA